MKKMSTKMRKVDSTEGDRIFQPVDFIVGKICKINKYSFRILDCDERTRKWYRDNFGLEMGRLE